MWKNMIIMLIVTGVIFGGIFGYLAFGNYMMKGYFASMKEPPVSVTTQKAATSAWQPRIRAVGDMRAVRGVDISSEVPGVVAEITFKSGDEVKEGTVLVKLNADADQAQLDALKAAADLALTVYERDKKQLEVQAISQAVVESDAAELKSRRAQVAQQEAILAKKVIKAPFTGKLGISSVSTGQYLNPGEKIVTLQALDTMLVDFYLPQQELSRLSLGQTVSIMTDTYPGRIFQGQITALNALVEKDSRNIQVEATVANPKRELLPGMFATLQVEVGREKEYVTIPQTAIAFNPYGETVYVVDEGGKDSDGKPLLKARQLFITTGETRGDMVAVLTGIKAGDTVITVGQHKLRNGSVVVVNNKVQPAMDTDPQVRDM